MIIAWPQGVKASGQAVGAHQTAQLRQLVCGHLGLGSCDGKQLLKQLNRYKFTSADLEQALLFARGRLASNTEGV